MRRFTAFLAAATGITAGAYAAYAALAWRRFGRPSPAPAGERDDLLDRFMPTYDVVERHHVRVAAPAGVTFATAGEIDLFETPIAKALFKARELLLRSTPEPAPQTRGLLETAEAIGWRPLARVPDREIVFGAVTQPWEANATFRGLSPEEFAAFREPGYVKIAWTLRADPIEPGGQSIFRTETRAVATDVDAYGRFRRYWSFLSPGIILIRLASLGPLKAEAERRALVGARG